MKKIIIFFVFLFIISGCSNEDERSELEICLDKANEDSIIDMGDDAKKDDYTFDDMVSGLDGYDEKEKECYKKYK